MSNQRKRKTRKRIEIAKFAFSTYFDFFDSIVINDDSEWNIFNEFTSILQRFQQLQFLHRKSNLLNLLHDCLMSFVLNWFKNQSKFISLHDFDIIFTKTFFFQIVCFAKTTKIWKFNFKSLSMMSISLRNLKFISFSIFFMWCSKSTSIRIRFAIFWKIYERNHRTTKSKCSENRKEN